MNFFIKLMFHIVNYVYVHVNNNLLDLYNVKFLENPFM